MDMHIISERAPFAPTAFIETVIEAVLPLIDGESLKPGLSRTVDVVEALRPLFGNYTVADGVSVYFLFESAEHALRGEDGARIEAHNLVQLTLIDFACRANATTPACVSSRAYLLRHSDEEESALGPEDLSWAHKMMGFDVGDLRTGRFQGELFSSLGWREKMEEA